MLSALLSKERKYCVSGVALQAMEKGKAQTNLLEQEKQISLSRKPVQMMLFFCQNLFSFIYWHSLLFPPLRYCQQVDQDRAFLTVRSSL